MPDISAILTAAGESTRMGCPKALLRWRGRTLLEYQIECLVEAGVDEVIVVLGHKADDLIPHIKGESVRYILNLDYKLGKTTSIKLGQRNVARGIDDILLLAIDQPRTTGIISKVIQSHAEKNAVLSSPRYQGHGGHPLIFSSALRGELECISERREGVREVFRSHANQINMVDIDDPMIRLDINTPEAYENARSVYGA